MRRGQGVCACLARLPPHVPAAHIRSQWHPRQRRAAPLADCVPPSPVLIRQLLPRAGAGQARAVEARSQPWASSSGLSQQGVPEPGGRMAFRAPRVCPSRLWPPSSQKPPRMSVWDFAGSASLRLAAPGVLLRHAVRSIGSSWAGSLHFGRGVSERPCVLRNP